MYIDFPLAFLYSSIVADVVEVIAIISAWKTILHMFNLSNRYLILYTIQQRFGINSTMSTQICLKLVALLKIVS